METKKLLVMNNQDRISYLPESIRGRIVSFLPIADVFRVRTLSSRWKNICSSLTHFNINQHHFPKTLLHKYPFKDLVYQTLIQHNRSDIETFKLSVYSDPTTFIDIKTWLTFAIRHNVKELDFSILSGKFDTLPSCLFSCNSLTSLSLNSINLKKVPQFFKNFPNLKSLSLVSIEFGFDRDAIKLISSCPFLEELSIVSCYFKNLDVLKTPLKNLKFLKLVGLSRFLDVEFSYPDLRRVYYSGRPPSIDADTLSCLWYAEFNLTMLPPCANGESRELIEHRVTDIMVGLCNVRKLRLEGLCIEFLTRDSELFTRMPSSYCRLTQLKLDLYPDVKQVRVVMLLLNRFPNLQTLSIAIKTLTLTNMAKIGGYQQLPESSDENALKWLRKVEIEYFGGSEGELDLLKFLLENGSVMEEMNINYSPAKQTDRVSRGKVNEKLATFTRASLTVAICFS